MNNYFRFIIGLCALLFLSVSSVPRASLASTDDEHGPMEIGAPTTTARQQPVAHGEIKLISYNIRWRGGDDLERLIETLRNDREIGHANVLALQEADRNKKRTNNTNTIKRIASALNMYYAWAAPPVPSQTANSREAQEEETGVALLSEYPMTDIKQIVLPNPGPKGRRRVAIGATLKIESTEMRVYSVHAETRIPVSQKIEQYRAVIDDLNQHPKIERAIIMGDFNTWEGDAVGQTTKLFTSAKFSTPFSEQEPTWKRFIIQLKLDWVWLRGPLEVKSYGIDHSIGLSDHWPLWLNIKL
ncbi:MAG TPA: endonuclease/exonuclease/phosphatase family protein [Pyrinomonadaceae bacterium]|nr:endonuclease/exonuclease/phosphatase family protein [Pyrinomonadaceae bacterium]